MPFLSILFSVLIFYSHLSYGRIEILTGSELIYPTHHGCNDYLKLILPLPHELPSIDSSSQDLTARMTRKQVIDTYRALGTATEEELKYIETADDKFPRGSILYIRSVNDATGAVEGIMRVVSGNPFHSHYFNNEIMPTSPIHDPHIPMYYAYPSKEFREFLEKNYPNAVEFGRLVFGEKVNRSRVLNDLFTAAAALTYQPPRKGVPARQILLEVVPKALPMVEAYPFKKKATPITLDNKRTFMVSSQEELYQKLIGSVTAPSAEINKAVENVSENQRVREVYSLGHYYQALSHFWEGNFKKMLEAANILKKNDPHNREYRFIELLAEAGSRFNWKDKTGNLDEALHFLNSPEAKERFKNENLPESLYPEIRLFYMGYLNLVAGKIEEARAIREEIENHLKQRTIDARKRGKIDYVALPTLHARMMIDTFSRTIFDPLSKHGDAENALVKVLEAEEDAHYGLTAQLFDYKAAVLLHLGKLEESRRAKSIADRLR